MMNDIQSMYEHYLLDASEGQRKRYANTIAAFVQFASGSVDPGSISSLAAQFAKQRHLKKSAVNAINIFLKYIHADTFVDYNKLTDYNYHLEEYNQALAEISALEQCDPLAYVCSLLALNFGYDVNALSHMDATDFDTYRGRVKIYLNGEKHALPFDREKIKTHLSMLDLIADYMPLSQNTVMHHISKHIQNGALHYHISDLKRLYFKDRRFHGASDQELLEAEGLIKKMPKTTGAFIEMAYQQPIVLPKSTK
jgi:hypothetical protein